MSNLSRQQMLILLIKLQVLSIKADINLVNRLYNQSTYRKGGC